MEADEEPAVVHGFGHGKVLGRAADLISRERGLSREIPADHRAILDAIVCEVL
jgi:hypothetical protein